MLILLGLQFQNNQRTKHIPALILANGMRLIGGAVVGLVLASVWGLQGAAYQAGVIEAATPTAVIATVLSTEFDAEPAFVTTVVFTSTILSPLTLTPLLAFLGA
jgi:predicted permease